MTRLSHPPPFISGFLWSSICNEPKRTKRHVKENKREQEARHSKIIPRKKPEDFKSYKPPGAKRLFSKISSHSLSKFAKMAPSLEANASTTVKPSEMTLECPFLTRSGYDSENNRYFCDYEPWAYGLFAIACLLLIMVPLVLIICCVVRNRHKRRFERRLRSTLSNTSYSSSEVPYQPLTRDRRKNYGATENGGSSTSRFSPNEESVSETPSQQHDNTSTTSNKASLYPNYDQSSLDHRNASAFHTVPRNSELAKGQNSKSDVSPYPSTKLVTDSVPPLMDVPSKAKSPIYAVLEEPSPKEPLLGNTEGERTPSELLRSPEINIIPENNDENVESSEQQVPYDTDEEKKQKAERPDDLYTLPVVSYAPNKELKSTLHEEVPSTTDSESRDSSPVYNVLEQPLPDVPETKLSTPQEEVPRLEDSESRESSPVYNVLEPPLPAVPEVERSPVTGVKSLVDDNISRDGNSDHTKPSAECTDTPESIYTPLVPPIERSSGDGASSTDSGIYQPLTPKRRERFTSRTDYEEFLLEMIKSLPEEQRNGAFVVRDSVTNPGSKALTVYKKSLNSGKEVFNFKVCFDDKGQVFLAKSTKRFPSLEQLLQYLRTNKDMLPCTLTSQVN